MNRKVRLNSGVLCGMMILFGCCARLERVYYFFMYTIDGQDEVIELQALPASDVGAPCPILLAEERNVVICYFLPDAKEQQTEKKAFVKFTMCHAHYFGAPNDEAFSGHPLAKYGLEPYGCFQVRNSSWIRQMERMNSVHPYHRKEPFDRLNHYILTFHDSVFECLAETYSFIVVNHPHQTADNLWEMLQSQE